MTLPFDGRPSWVNENDPMSMTARWWAFHCSHPEVAGALAQLARPLVKQGRRHLGIAVLWETLRYNSMIGATPDEDEVRLNNNWRAYYARWLMETVPDLAGVFEVRVSQAEGITRDDRER